MVNLIAIDGGAIFMSIKKLLETAENESADSITQIPTSVKKFTVNGQTESNGGVEPLALLVERLQEALLLRGTDASSIVKALSGNIEALELVIKDMSAREDEHASTSLAMLEDVHDDVGAAGAAGANPTIQLGDTAGAADSVGAPSSKEITFPGADSGGDGTAP